MRPQILIDNNSTNHISLEEVQKKAPFSRMCIAILIRQGKFPHAYANQNRKRVWIKKEIDEYVKRIENKGK